MAVDTQTQTCVKCGEDKPLDAFAWHYGRGVRYRRNKCRLCHAPDNQIYSRRHKMKKRYGLSLEEYDQILTEQGGKCAICGVVPDYNLRVDHDHFTDEVRGLLCISCNTTLGNVKEDPEVLRKAALYLESYA